MKKSTVEHLLSSYLEPLGDYLESRWSPGQPERWRSMYEILLGEKLDPALSPMKGARIVMRRRIADALKEMREPTSNELEHFEELKRRVKRISRLAVWKILRKVIAALIPRGHGHGPKPKIGENEFQNIIAAVEHCQSEHPKWKQEEIYREVGQKIGRGWRTIQDAYLEAKKRQNAKDS